MSLPGLPILSLGQTVAPPSDVAAAQTPPLPTVRHTSVATAPPVKRSRYSIPLMLIALALVGIGIYVWRLRAPQATIFSTQPVVRKTLTLAASATGTVNPQDTISVGSQVSGTISMLLVDYNSRVHKGEILARIDPSTFAAQADQARAALAQANAQVDVGTQTGIAARSAVEMARADAGSATALSAASLQNLAVARQAIASADTVVARTNSSAVLARRTLQRDAALLGQGYLAQSTYDSDQTALVAAESALQSARVSSRQARLQASASLEQSRSSDAQRTSLERQVVQRRAQALGSDASIRANVAASTASRSQLEQANLNLARSVIVSPVDGTVIARNVSVGQTIAASFAAPTLFTIAKDLKKMEVDIAVGEPDIGTIVAGAPVSFTVLAYPNDVFAGTVSQVRENPTTIANVVTYTVVTLVDNRSGRLRPGMTATAAIRVAQIRSALVVPVQALQWRPGTKKNATPASAASPGGTSTGASSWGRTDTSASSAIIAGTTGAVYVREGATQRRVVVRVDLVSGPQIAISPVGGALHSGDAVVTGSSTGGVTN